MSRYHAIYQQWKDDPEGFWGEAAQAVSWDKPFTSVFDPSMGRYGRWFAGGACNTAYNCLDRHVEKGNGEVAALIYDSPVTGSKRTYTYRELRDEVATFAAVLADQGVVKGDRVILYMPMIPEAVIAMLACARLGAIHSVVFGGFAANELATRIDDAKPKLIVSASCGVEPGRIVKYKPLLDAAIAMSPSKPQGCIILQRPQQTCELGPAYDHDWTALMTAARAAGKQAPCVSVAATDPLYILYTSGSTGQPKGVVRDHGGHMVALQWTMEAIYGVKPGEVFWAASDVGWVVGHSYIVYAPLLNGSTTIVYEGKPVGTPDPGAFWRVCAEHNVAVLFTAPTAFRAIKKEDPDGTHIGKYDLSNFRTLFLAGERADPDTVKWAEQKLGVPVIDHWWQTETGWAIAANPIGLGALPVKHGSPSVPMPGYDVQVLDDAGHEVDAGQLGNITVKLPLPPGCLPTLWNAEERFRAELSRRIPRLLQDRGCGLQGCRRLPVHHGPHGRHHQRRGPSPLHRCDGGSACRAQDVAECAVIGAADALKGELPVGFLVLKAGVTRPAAEIEKEVVDMVRQQIGPVAAFKTAIVVQRLPKTRSGKILRGTMKKIADKTAFKMPATIDDPTILEEITGALSSRKIV